MFMDSIGVDTYKITRADMRFDSYDQRIIRSMQNCIVILSVCWQSAIK